MKVGKGKKSVQTLGKVVRKLPVSDHGRGRYTVVLENGKQVHLFSPAIIEPVLKTEAVDDATVGKSVADILGAPLPEITSDFSEHPAAPRKYKQRVKPVQLLAVQPRRSSFHFAIAGMKISFEDDKRIVIERE